MARMTSMEALEIRIEKAQEKVSRTKKQYDDAIAVLSDLLDKRDALKRDLLRRRWRRQWIRTGFCSQVDQI